MKITRLRIAGFRGFNDEQPVELDGPLVIYCGANGTGKTSIGEALEWLLYGRTLKRSKGDELSKREYAESYRNAHFSHSTKPFVEASVLDQHNKPRLIRRELNFDESSSLSVDGKPATDLQEFGVVTTYDRPLILQHTLQDFIFMKPKTRYEVLSAMLGLEGLITFRNAVEEAKTELPKQLPESIRRAQAKAAEVQNEFGTHDLLKPVLSGIAAGDLKAAKDQLLQISLGRVQAGTPESELISTLESTRAAKERAQLDWGRFSLSPVAKPGEHAAVTGLKSFDNSFERFHEQLAEAVRKVAEQKKEHVDPRRRDFVGLGLELLDPVQKNRCPFCGETTLTPKKLSELKEVLSISPEGQAILADAKPTLLECRNIIRSHRESVQSLVPKTPSGEDQTKIQTLAADHKENVNAYLESTTAINDKVKLTIEASETLENVLKSALLALGEGKMTDEADINKAYDAYASAVKDLPGVANGYAATYAALDPHIKAKLASAEDVKFLKILVAGLEHWADIELACTVEACTLVLQDLIRDTRRFIAAKQTEILGSRDKEIRAWYDLLNPGAEVGYDKIVPSTDSLELHARSFSKTMMAAPNLSTSQLNCLGLAVYLACATRKGSPHGYLLFDDPIQSMDDDHTQSFKKDVVKKLIDDGYQVFVFTHMDTFARSLESLYRKSVGAVLYRIESYNQSGPNIVQEGPELLGLLHEVRKNKDAPNEGYRKQATTALRQFVERFVKDFYVAETGNPISKTYEDKNWPELKNLLRQCKQFTPDDEPVLQDTHDFTSKHLHTDDTAPAKVPSPAHLNPHYNAMRQLLEKYKDIFGIKAV